MRKNSQDQIQQNFINELSGKSVAVTGASGYIGSALADTLNNHSVKVLRVSRRDLPPKAGMEDLKADIRTEDCWQEIVNRAEIVFHLAGTTSVYDAEKDPAGSLISTLLPVNHLIAAAQASKRIPRVVFASTATVYGLTDNLPVPETAEANPVTVYDLHKLSAEKQLALATSQGILQSVSLRLANVYGPSSSESATNDRGILNKITRMALQGKVLQLYGDGNYLRDYVYIDDVEQAFMLAAVIRGIEGQAINVASGTGIAVKDAFQEVADQAGEVKGKRVNIEHVPWPAGANVIEFRNFIADIGLLNGFMRSTRIGLDEGISLLISQYVRSGLQ